MRVFVLRAVLMLTLAVLAVSAISAGMSLGVSGSDAAYMTIVTSVSSVLVAIAMWLTRGMRDADADADSDSGVGPGPGSGLGTGEDAPR